METGDLAKYMATGTVGRIEETKESEGRVWFNLDTTGLFYLSETLVAAPEAEYEARSSRESRFRNNPLGSRQSIEDLSEMEREVDIDDITPSGAG